MDVGFIGLGNMGARLVELLLAADHHVTVWARRAASTEPFAGRVDVAASPAEVGAASDVVGVCVWDEHDVESVLDGDSGVFAGLRAGGVVVVHSTIAPDACARFQARALECGFGLVDAPVSVGTNLPKLLVMVGGDAAAVERCQPVLDAMGEPVLHLGPIGSGQIAKLMNNCLLAAEIGLGADAVALGVDLGLDGAALAAALSAGSASGIWAGFVTRSLAAAPATAAGGGRTSEWARKDLGLTIDLVRKAGVDVHRPVLDLGARGADLLDGG